MSILLAPGVDARPCVGLINNAQSIAVALQNTTANSTLFYSYPWTGIVACPQNSATNMSTTPFSPERKTKPSSPLGYGQNSPNAADAKSSDLRKPPNSPSRPLGAHVAPEVEPRRTRRATPTLSTREALLKTLSSSEPCDILSRDPPASLPAAQPTNHIRPKGRPSIPATAETSRSETPRSEEASPSAEVAAQPFAHQIAESPSQHVFLPDSNLGQALAAGQQDVTIKHRDRLLVVREPN